MGGLGAQDRVGRAMAGMVRSIFRISIIKRNMDKGLAFLQAFGRGDPDDPDNQDLLQEADTDHIQHYGLETHPPTGTEGIVVDSDGGEACIAERFSLDSLDTHGGADAMPTRNQGDTVLYSKDGTYIFLDADGNLTIKAMTANVEIITEAGKQIKLGQDGPDYRDAAYSYPLDETKASQVASGSVMNTWTHQVSGDIAAIKADLASIRTALNLTIAQVNTLIGWSQLPAFVPATWAAPGVSTALALTPLTPATLVPDTVDGINTNVDHSYVSSGSEKVEVEP